VTGTVLDAQDTPVADARISILPEGAFSGGLPFARSDRNGHYRLVSWVYGKTWISAVKERAGYPDTNNLLFAPEVDDRPEVLLSPGSYFELDIHLGQPDGILEATVVDATTGRALPDARILMRRDKPPSDYSGTIPADGHFLFALPEAPIELTVTAPGYRNWRYADKKTGSNKLVLSSSDHLMIKIRLSPER